MTNAQTIFLKDKPVLDYWTSIAVTDNFQKVITYARAAILEGETLSPDTIAGVNLLATTLVTMINAPEEPSQGFNIGLVHDLQPKRNTGKTETKKEK